MALDAQKRGEKRRLASGGKGFWGGGEGGKFKKGPGVKRGRGKGGPKGPPPGGAPGKKREKRKIEGGPGLTGKNFFFKKSQNPKKFFFKLNPKKPFGLILKGKGKSLRKGKTWLFFCFKGNYSRALGKKPGQFWAINLLFPFFAAFGSFIFFGVV